MNYMICCDLATLCCTSEELESKIANNSSRYYKLSDSLWLFCTPKHIVSHIYMSPEEYFVTNVLDEYITPDSVVFIFAIQKTNCFYELPQDAVDFLSADQADDD